MWFGEIVQDNNPEKQIPKNEKKENNFLDSNLDIKKIWENIKSQYASFDLDNFAVFVQELLEDNNIKKEDLNKYLENILKKYLESDHDFIFDSEDNYLLISIKKEIIKTEKDKVAIENINKEIKNLNKLSQSIPDTFKPDLKSEEFKYEIKNLNIWYIQKQLNWTWITTDEYLTHRYTAQKLSKSWEMIPNKYEFIRSFNQLSKLLKIDIQIPLFQTEKINYKPLPDSLDDFQTKPEKILALDSVQNYIDKSSNVLNDKDINIPDQHIIKLYSDKIPDTIKEILSKNNLDQTLIKYFDFKNYDEKNWILDSQAIKAIQDDKLLNQLQQISQTLSQNYIKQWKEQLKQITEKIIKEKIMTSIFRWVSDFFDITNKNIENFSSDFKLDFNQDLDFQNNIIIIYGQINWSHIWLHYDLSLWKLSMDDVISFDAENKLYKIWKKTWTLLDIPIQLPKLNDFYTDARKFNYKDISKKSDNIDQYQDDLDKQLGSVFYWNFIHKELNQYYIRRLNEKNLAVQSAFNYTFDNWSLASWNDKSFDISQNIELKEYLNTWHFEFVKIIDDSFEYYNKSDNLLKIRNLFEKFNLLINSKNVRDWNCNEKIINTLFNSREMLSSWNAWKSMWNSNNFNYLTFYRLISKSKWDKQIIDLNILENIINILEKWEWFWDKDNKKRFNWSFWNKYEKVVNDPDKDLENSLNKI